MACTVILLPIPFTKVKLNKISYSIDDFPKGNAKIEKFANAACDYIKEVEHLINEIILYSSRGEKEQFLKYWVEVLIKDCKKSKQRLDMMEVKYDKGCIF